MLALSANSYPSRFSPSYLIKSSPDLYVPRDESDSHYIDNADDDGDDDDGDGERGS